jgi:NTP pyrophosphatase (non-canonical NTP hydrolase)
VSLTQTEVPSYIMTFSGLKVNPLTLTPEQVRLEDVAYSLAGQNRWLGHSRPLFSVAAHCLLVCWIVRHVYKGGAVAQLLALTHDAEEAYLGDMPNPLKTHTDLGRAYRAVSAPVQAIVETALVGAPMSHFGSVVSVVRAADSRALAYDVTLGMPGDAQADYHLDPSKGIDAALLRRYRKLIRQRPQEVARRWLRTYASLYGRTRGVKPVAPAPAPMPPPAEGAIVHIPCHSPEAPTRPLIAAVLSAVKSRLPEGCSAELRTIDHQDGCVGAAITVRQEGYPDLVSAGAGGTEAEAYGAAMLDLGRYLTPGAAPNTTALSVAAMAVEAHRNSADKGFWVGDLQKVRTGIPKPAAQQVIGQKLALIHSEISEALEELRVNPDPRVRRVTDKGKPEGFGSELADVVIRVGDLAEACEINLEAEIAEKLAYNRERPPLHGKHFLCTRQPSAARAGQRSVTTVRGDGGRRARSAVRVGRQRRAHAC